MKMKFVLTVLLFVSISGLYAQDKSNEERAKMLTENMKKNLSLTEDQYEKAYTINLAFVSKVSQIRDSGGGRLGKARKLKSADGDRDKMLKGVLTEEQYKKFKEQKAENREEMKKRYEQRKENG
jgi:Spy/CpxP family protein refolding chaperone